MAQPALRSRIDLPAVPVRSGGVIDVATVIDASAHDLIGVTAESDACISGPRFWLGDLCGPNGDTKDFTGDTWMITGEPFTIYAAATCEIGLQSLEETRATARRRFNYNERVGVDSGVQAALAALAVNWGPVTPNDVLSGIAEIEQTLAETYGGVGTIVAGVAATTRACGRQYLNRSLDGGLSTCLGTEWAASSESATPNRLYGFGHLFLLRGPLQEFEAMPNVTPDGEHTGHIVLLERTYVPVIDCEPGYVDISPTLCDCAAAGAVGTQQPTGPAPELSYLSDTSVSVSAPPFALHAHGENFTDDSTIVIDGDPKPTAFIDDHELVTVLIPANHFAGDAEVKVTSPNGSSAALTLSFTA